MTVTEDRGLSTAVSDRLPSISKYPSSQNLYYNWEHSSFKTDVSREVAKPKAFIRYANH